MSKRDDFPANVIRSLQYRAAFICSNPDCKRLTMAPSTSNESDWLYVGKAAHISAAAKGGPRYDNSLTPQQRQDVSNGIFLCAVCADMIDKNNGADFASPTLKEWKVKHESWVMQNLNKDPHKISEVAGTHEASGIGEVTGLRISKPTKIAPGTIARAQGIGRITGTSIE